MSDPAMAGLRDRMLSGVFWTTNFQGATTLLVLVFQIVLARILVPSDFGLVGMALIFTGLVGVLFSLGLATALIQAKDHAPEAPPTVFWINLAIGCAAAAAIYAAAPAVALWFGEERLVAVLRVMSATFVLGSFGSVPTALLSKRMDFRRLGLAGFFAILGGSVCAVTLALLGAGYWSIVGGSIAQTVLNSVLLTGYSGWLPSASFSLASVRPLAGFGIFKTLLAIANYAIRNVDYLIVGKVLGATALGYYTIAFQIAGVAARKYRNIFGMVAFPAFAEIREDSELFRRGFTRLTSAAVIVLLPVSAMVLLLAGDFIPLFYGEKWTPSVVVLEILALGILFQGLNNQINTMLMSLGDAKKVFTLFVGESLLLAVLVLAAVRHGIGAVAVAVVVTAAAMHGVKLKVFARAVPLDGRSYLAALARPAKVIFPAALLLVTARRLFGPGSPTPLSFALWAAAGGGILLAAVWLVLDKAERDAVAEYLGKYLPAFRRRKEEAP